LTTTLFYHGWARKGSKRKVRLQALQLCIDIPRTPRWESGSGMGQGNSLPGLDSVIVCCDLNPEDLQTPRGLFRTCDARILPLLLLTLLTRHCVSAVQGR
jgi:hypothetical protein